MEALLIFVATGAAAGILAGLFGVGGGLIMVPALAFVGLKMQVAIGTSLAVIAATSLSSTLAHHRRDGVRWPVFAGLAPGLAGGAALGAFVAHLLSGVVLQRIVGTGAVLVAIQMLNKGDAHLYSIKGVRPLYLLAAGSVIGLLSALVGIGGGSLTVPFLSACGLNMRHAVGTAAACGIPIAWGGAAAFMVAGAGVAGRPEPSLGYVSLAAFAGLALASVLTAPLGARLAHTLPQRALKQAFAALLLVIGVTLLLK